MVIGQLRYKLELGWCVIQALRLTLSLLKECKDKPESEEQEKYQCWWPEPYWDTKQVWWPGHLVIYATHSVAAIFTVPLIMVSVYFPLACFWPLPWPPHPCHPLSKTTCSVIVSHIQNLQERKCFWYSWSLCQLSMTTMSSYPRGSKTNTIVSQALLCDPMG